MRPTAKLTSRSNSRWKSNWTRSKLSKIKTEQDQSWTRSKFSPRSKSILRSNWGWDYCGVDLDLFKYQFWFLDCGQNYNSVTIDSKDCNLNWSAQNYNSVTNDSNDCNSNWSGQNYNSVTNDSNDCNSNWSAQITIQGLMTVMIVIFGKVWWSWILETLVV